MSVGILFRPLSSPRCGSTAHGWLTLIDTDRLGNVPRSFFRKAVSEAGVDEDILQALMKSERTSYSLRLFDQTSTSILDNLCHKIRRAGFVSIDECWVSALAVDGEKDVDLMTWVNRLLNLRIPGSDGACAFRLLDVRQTGFLSFDDIKWLRYWGTDASSLRVQKTKNRHAREGVEQRGLGTRLFVLCGTAFWTACGSASAGKRLH